MNLRPPWKAIAGKSNYRFEVEDARGFTVCRVVGGLLDGGKQKAELLAAAPALHDVAAGLVLYFGNASPEECALMVAEDPSSLGMWVEAARKAISEQPPAGPLISPPETP